MYVVRLQNLVNEHYIEVIGGKWYKMLVIPPYKQIFHLWYLIPHQNKNIVDAKSLLKFILKRYLRNIAQ